MADRNNDEELQGGTFKRKPSIEHEVIQADEGGTTSGL
jgi:hypothetical protein